jgi:hypothetical protein
MSYIGKEPADSFISFAKQDFSTSATTSYTLDNAVTNENELALFINFVRQEPTTAYTASGTTLTLTSATASSDDMYCVYLGQAQQTVNAPDGSVGSSQVAASIITGQTALGATPADTDELLISDAGTLKRVDYSYLKSANTPYFLVQKTSSQTLSDNTSTKITFDSETIDSDSAFASDKFTVPSGKAGKYYLNASVEDYDSDGSIQDRKLYIYKNGSELFRHTLSYTNSGTTDLAMVTANISVTVDASVGDYYEVYYQGNTDDGGSFIVADNAKTTFFQGHKLIT